MFTSGAAYSAADDWTNTPSLSPDPQLHLTPLGRVSFVASDLGQFAAWLQRAGWRREPGKSPHEYGRFLRGRQLIVAYGSRTILVQGATPSETTALLRQLVPETQPAATQEEMVLL